MYQHFSERVPEALVRAVAHRRLAAQNGGGWWGADHWPSAPTIAISREVGAGGTTLARAVGRRLTWPVYDQELLVELAREMHVRVRELENVDERHVSWLEECVEAMSAGHRVNECAYVKHLTELVLSLGSQGACVVVGRGAAHLLPMGTTLRVRLIADLDDRIASICRERGMSRSQAITRIAATEQGRIRFVKDHFRKDPSDIHNYDLILNSSRTSIEDCADLVVDSLHRLERRSGKFAAAAG